MLGTALICRAEVAAAFAKAIRTGTTSSGAAESLQEFRNEGSDRLQITERLVAQADSLAWMTSILLDILFLGHFAVDRNVADGVVEIASGGGVYYGGIAAARPGARVGVVTRPAG